MKQSIYFAFKQKVKSEFLTRILTIIAYFLYKARLWLQSVLYNGKKQEPMSKEEAENVVSKQYPFIDVNLDEGEYKNSASMDCSIIIPVYNHENEIGRCINSALNQKTNYKYEVILIDDGSREPAKEVLKQYENLSKCVIVHQENKGIGGARNTGLNIARGRYIMFIDCDDDIIDDMLQKLLDSAYQNDSDIAFGGYSLLKEKDAVVYNTKEYIYNSWLLQTKSAEDSIMAFPGYPWGRVYKRELWERVRFLEGYLYEDSIIQFLIFKECKKYSYVEESFYNYRWNEKNFSKTQNSEANPKGVQRYWMVLLMIKKYKKLGLPMDDSFYITLLRHLGLHAYYNVRDFDSETQKAMLSLGRELLLKYKGTKKIKMTFAEKMVEKGLLDCNYDLWKAACICQ